MRSFHRVCNSFCIGLHSDLECRVFLFPNKTVCFSLCRKSRHFSGILLAVYPSFSLAPGDPETIDRGDISRPKNQASWKRGCCRASFHSNSSAAHEQTENSRLATLSHCSLVLQHSGCGCERKGVVRDFCRYIWGKKKISTQINMFKNTFQSGFLSILYSIGSKPLQIWDKKVSLRDMQSIQRGSSMCVCFWSRFSVKLLNFFLFQVRNGHIKRITDNDIQSLVLEVVGTNVR